MAYESKSQTRSSNSISKKGSFSMGLSYADALTQLNALCANNFESLSESALRNLIDALDISATGDITVLYSGSSGGIAALNQENPRSSFNQ